MDLRLPVGDGKLVFRVAGILIHENRVLLETSDSDTFWSAPGGGMQFREASADGLRREFREELGVEVNVERLLWLIEGFFDYRDQPIHGMILYYLVTLAGESELCQIEGEFRRRDYYGQGGEMIFQWHSLDKLEELKILPEFLKERLPEPLPETIEHIVYG